MSKILVNNNGFDVSIPDVGVTVAASSAYTIPPQDYATFAASSDVITRLAALELVLNDGGVDIVSLSQAIDVIKGWPIQVSETEDEPFFFDFADILVGEGPHSLFSQTIDPGLIISLTRIVVSCRVEAMVEVFKNGAVIGSLRTGAAQPMSSFDWRPNQELVEGDSIEVVLTKRANAPDNTVGVHLMGVQNTTT
jgi:hypothetical protein